MSDAEKQSVERCKYQHDWREGNPPEITGGHSRFYCFGCGYEPKEDSELWHEADAIIHLRSVCSSQGTRCTQWLRHVLTVRDEQEY